MTRAHLYRPIIDRAGNVREGAVVRVFVPGTKTLVNDTLYASDTGTEQLSNPLICADGIINFYIDQPRRVTLGIKYGSQDEVFFEGIDVVLPYDPAAPLGHVHPEGDVIDLLANLSEKAPRAHTHAEGDVGNLVADLSNKAALVHGHDYSPLGHVHDYAARSHTHDYAAIVHDHPTKAHTHYESEVIGLVDEIAGKADVGHTHVIPPGNSFKSTSGAGLPGTADRAPGDLHYDFDAKKEYVLTQSTTVTNSVDIGGNGTNNDAGAFTGGGPVHTTQFQVGSACTVSGILFSARDSTIPAGTRFGIYEDDGSTALGYRSTQVDTGTAGVMHTLPSPVNLVPGVTYRVLVESGNVAVDNTPPVQNPDGVVSVVGGTSVDGTNGPHTIGPGTPPFTVFFRLYGGQQTVSGPKNWVSTDDYVAPHMHAGGTAATTAFTPAGTVQSTNVQDAILEVAAEAIDLTAVHYKGDWSSTTAYKNTDEVNSAYGLYAALLDVPSGKGRPETNPIASVAAGTVNGGNTNPLKSTNESIYNSVAQAFTVGPNDITVSAITLYIAVSRTGNTARIGIASALGGDDSSVTWVGSTPAATSINSSPGAQTFTLPGTITLTKNTTYYMVAANSSGGQVGARAVAYYGQYAAEPFGGVASIANTFQAAGAYGGSYPSPWGAAYDVNFTIPFQLTSGGIPSYYWKKIANFGQDPSQSLTANNVTFTPGGTIQSTNVQAAIAEVASEAQQASTAAAANNFKSTHGAGLPAVGGRSEGDLHYNETDNKEYILVTVTTPSTNTPDHGFLYRTGPLNGWVPSIDTQSGALPVYQEAKTAFADLTTGTDTTNGVPSTAHQRRVTYVNSAGNTIAGGTSDSSADGDPGVKYNYGSAQMSQADHIDYYVTGPNGHVDLDATWYPYGHPMRPAGSTSLTWVSTDDYVAPHTHGSGINLTQTTGNRTLVASDSVVFFNGANLTATLPAMSGTTGRQHTIKNLNATVLTVAVTDGTIDGDTSRVLAQYDSLTVVSDGTNWGVI